MSALTAERERAPERADGRPTRGIGGVSARQGMIFGLSWPARFAALPAWRNRT